MKKFISMFMLVAIMCSMCSVSVFADHAHTLTLACSEEDGAVATGDEFVASVTLGTSDGQKALTARIVYDPNDFELGMSDDAKGFLADYEADDEGYETFEEYYVAMGDYAVNTWVDFDYIDSYSGLSSAKKWGDPTIGYEVKEDGKAYVTFAYAKASAIASNRATEDMPVGGVVLKVKTDAKKQSTITIVGDGSGADGVLTNATIANSITLNLNGYTGETKTEVDAVPTNDEGYTDAANAKAYAFYASLGEDASNKTFRWYATIGGEAMKYKKSFTTSDISGEGGVKYGLIYKGTKTITDAKLIEE